MKTRLSIVAPASASQHVREKGFASILATHSIPATIEHRDAAAFAATTAVFERRGGLTAAGLRRAAVRQFASIDAEVFVIEGPMAEFGPGLVVLDVDSTFIDQEVIELIADRAGVRSKVAALTEAAMRGELDFAQSLHARVATLAGLPQAVLEEVANEATYTPGARELVAAVQSAGGRVALVSGGFLEIVEPLAAPLAITDVLANRLETSGGVLTGRVRGDVVDAAAKERELRRLAGLHRIPMQSTLAVGDGANDARMVEAAGLGIAFCAKPVLRDVADAALSIRRLDALGAVLGLTPASAETA